MSSSPRVLPVIRQCSAETFHADVQFLEDHWRPVSLSGTKLPVLDLGEGEPLVFVPILEHLEFVYARQLQTFSRTRRVILYRRRESRRGFIGLDERVEELRSLLDYLHLDTADFFAHGDAAMVLLTFALRYPARCRSLVIVAQAADYRIAPHPWIWWLHETFMRLPLQRLVPAALIRRTVLNYITHTEPLPEVELDPATLSELPRALIEEQFCKIAQWPAVYRFSVLPVIHSFDIRRRLADLTMPILLINRYDDLLSPATKTQWLAEHLPACAGHYLVPGRERFFLYAEADLINPRIETFLTKDVLRLSTQSLATE